MPPCLKEGGVFPLPCPTAVVSSARCCAAPAAQEWEYLLEELALYFLMYSEAANLRHTPEASAGARPAALPWPEAPGLEGLGAGQRC